MRRLISIALAVAMFTPALTSVAEAAVANWLSPQPGQLVAGEKVEVAVGYNTHSDLKVTSLELLIDGKFYARKVLVEPTPRGVCSFWWDATRAAKGQHQLVIKVFAGDKLISTVSGTGTVGRSIVDVLAPVVQFSNIKSGDVLKGKRAIKIYATDDSGKAPLVSMLVDDTLKMLRNTPPYNYDLDTTTYQDGDHQLKTYAYDSSGNRSEPIVLKVKFKNGIKPATVTTLTVDHSLDSLPVDEVVEPEPKAAAQQPKAVPPAKATSSKKGSAGRVQESRTARTTSPAPAAPVKVVPRAKTVAAAAPKTQPAPPAVAAPAKVDVAPVSVNVRKETLKPSAVSGGLHADEPSATAEDSAAAAPVENSVIAELPPADDPVSTASASATEVVLPDPTPSSATRMAMAPTAALRADHAVRSAEAPSVPSEFVSDPSTTAIKNVVISVPKSGLKNGRQIAYLAPAKARVPAVPRQAPPKPVRTGMSPDVRDAEARMHTGAAITHPPVPPRSTKARIEKVTVPSSGKVKARDLFEKLGGVLFWDPQTHTVTVFLNDMKIEMAIGSRYIKVNGHSVRVDSAPRIVNGRTVIGVDVYHQACALVQGKRVA